MSAKEVLCARQSDKSLPELEQIIMKSFLKYPYQVQWEPTENNLKTAASNLFSKIKNIYWSFWSE